MRKREQPGPGGPGTEQAIAGATGVIGRSFGLPRGVWGASEGDGIPGAGMEG